MKLTKDINTKIYEVLTDYKVKVKKSPFIAILKHAVENEGEITKTLLYDFLQPLSEKACENILERLTKMGCFSKENSSYEHDDYRFDDEYSNRIYSLTILGKDLAKNEEFYENRNGILKIHIIENEFVSQDIVKIEEIRRPDFFDKDNLEVIQNTELEGLQNPNEQIDLENGTFIISKFKEKCRVFENKKNKLILVTDKEDSEIKFLDYSIYIPSNTNDIKEVILFNKYHERYLIEEKSIKVDFNFQKLELKRSVKIQKPLINDTFFDPIEIKNVKFSPTNIDEARKWFKALLTQSINKYFISNIEFNEFANKIALEFELYSKDLKNDYTKEDIVKELNNTEYFYKKVKLETIDYLNY